MGEIVSYFAEMVGIVFAAETNDSAKIQRNLLHPKKE